MTANQSSTRRRFLQLSAATATATALGTTTTAADPGTWESTKSPVDVTLHDVETTAANAFAVGGAGVVVERTQDGWRKVVDGGPTGNGNSLYGADVTDDGKRLWFVGASGAIGEYDVETGNLESHSAPNDSTNNFNDVAVTGDSDEANVYVAGDSGSVHYSFENGATGTWNYVAVGQGAAIQAIDFHGPRTGHLVNGNANVFYTGDGTTWNKTGIADADVSLYGVDSDAKDDVHVAAGSGVVYRYKPDSEGTPKWFRTKVGEPSLRDIEKTDDDGYAVGDAGAVFDQESGEWGRDETPNGQGLTAVVDTDGNDIAVGASGTIVETNPDAEAEPGSDTQTGQAADVTRTSTNTSGQKKLEFTVQNTGDSTVTVDAFALQTNVQVETISRDGGEVIVPADDTGYRNSEDPIPVDGELRALDTPGVFDAGTEATAHFKLYDGGNVALAVDPVDERPSGNYISATLQYGDDTRDTFYFAVTNVNS
ncbi:hypothetical protein [Halorubellus sp. PRR65]|uniref:WD40/YVTN/BNR-like repeat-containing protein n=1 Tax=Halorubellus sp. PRR65 TaxID=3098148 RepID=UPI002B261181|nr:hypothetical protein [Halorubellus sp. PRR65]